MRKTVRYEDPEVQAIMEAGTQSLEWVAQEFAGIDLCDKRPDRRLIKTAQQLGKSPASPINEACGDWASTQAAYRLFDNGKASPEAILEPHIKATAERAAAAAGAVLIMQDTVFFSYGQNPKTRGIGPIGNSNSEHERGLIMHNALAFTASGVPLGLLSQNIWARQEVPEEGYQDKILRLQCTPIEEKESFKWLRALHETMERTPRGVQFITVADRESDFFEFLTQAQQQRARFLIRACTDRMLVPEDSAGHESILEALGGAKVLGTTTVKIPGNGKRKARTADIEVRVAQVTIKPPQRRGRAKASGSTEPISVTVIGATESVPPEGQEEISWVLLTNLLVPDFEAAERLSRYLTLFSIIGVRLMHVAYLARVQPDIPASQVFSKGEIEALYVPVHHALPPAKSATLREAVRMLGSLGGHLGRKCDGEPGMTVIWRGWMRLYETVIALRAGRQAGVLNSS